MTGTVKVWDRFVRVFHWSAAILTLTALLTEDNQLALHVLAGYLLLGLLVLRIGWGFTGPATARFANFCYPPSVVLHHLRALARLRPQRYLGHSPAGGAMIVALLVVLILLGVTGMATYGAEEHAGPLAGMFSEANIVTRGWLAGLHQALANLLWLMILVHLAGVALASYAHRENLVRSMVTGIKSAALGARETTQSR